MIRRTMHPVDTGSNPLVTVIIPCFNYARYVGTAIESVLSQDYRPLQVVVVNDGSTDDSLQVISRYSDRVRVIDQENQGHVAACNHGFAATTGPIVCFLDADDRLEPTALRRVVEAFSPGTAKVQFDLKVIDGEGKDLGRRSCHFSGDYDAVQVRAAFRRKGTYRWPVTAGNAYARWFLDEVFPLSAEDAPDGLLNTVAPVYGDVVTIPEALGCYRIHGSNRWASNGSDPARLPKRIRFRHDEVRFMRRRAEERGVAVPEGNVLDHELPFIHYRLMALRLGLDYEGRQDDTPAHLLRMAWNTVRDERLSLRMGAAHMLWFGVLAMAPAGVANGLYRLRANRSALVPLLKQELASSLERLARIERAST
jgi:glycosyltransferase involved in cell wall biosynthesis